MAASIPPRHWRESPGLRIQEPSRASLSPLRSRPPPSHRTCATMALRVHALASSAPSRSAARHLGGLAGWLHLPSVLGTA